MRPSLVACSVLLVAAVLWSLPRDTDADSIGGLVKYLACLQKLASSSGECGKKRDDFNVVAEVFGKKEGHHGLHDSREKKGLCCKFSGYVDCYLKHVRTSCGEAAGKYALKFIEMTTQKYVRNTCEKFDKRKCSAASAPVSSAMLISSAVAAILAFSLVR